MLRRETFGGGGWQVKREVHQRPVARRAGAWPHAPARRAIPFLFPVPARSRSLLGPELVVLLSSNSSSRSSYSSRSSDPPLQARPRQLVVEVLVQVLVLFEVSELLFAETVAATLERPVDVSRDNIVTPARVTVVV